MTDDDDIIIEITGKPVAKGRGRIGMVKDRPMIFTPQKTRQWERDARTEARQVMGPRRPLPGPLLVSVDIVMPIPKSWPRWKRDAAIAGRVAPTTKPDADNCVKAVKDAFNGIVWLDDCQIVEVVARKRYDEAPAVRVRVRPATDRISAQETKQPDRLKCLTDKILKNQPEREEA